MFDLGENKRPSRRRLAIVLIGTGVALWTAGWFVATAAADVYDHFFRSSTTWFAPSSRTESTSTTSIIAAATPRLRAQGSTQTLFT